MDVYRINKEPYHTDPLSVVGSHRYGGRWNPKGMGILYTSRTPELALLETLVHLPPLTLTELPQLWLSTLRLPIIPGPAGIQPSETDSLLFWLELAKLPPFWRLGTLAETQLLLTEWLTRPFSLGIAVPSVIIEESYNILLHPEHPLFARIEVVSQRIIPLDSRLTRRNS